MLLATCVRTAIAVPFTKSFFAKRFYLFLHLIFLFGGCQAVRAAGYSPPVAIVHFTNDQGLMLVGGRVGKVSGYFILDTGANGLVLNGKHFNSRALATKRAYGLQGVSKVGRTPVSEFTLGPLRFGPTSAQVIDLEGIAGRINRKLLGLVGYEVLEAYEITLNYHSQEITFSPLDEWGNYLGTPFYDSPKADSMAITLENFLPVVTVRVNGQAKRMGIDTGAEYNLLDARRSTGLMANFRPLGSVKLHSADGRKEKRPVGKLSGVLLGDRYRCAPMYTLLVDFRHFDDIYQTKLDGILGKEFLAPWVFSINYRKRMLYVHQMKFVPPIVNGKETALK